MTRPSILLVASSHSAGWYLPEFAHPYAILSPHTDITVASPAGGKTTLDPVSVELFKDDAVCTEFKNTKEHLWMNTRKLEDFADKVDEFDAIFFIGGFGPMFDLVDNPVSTGIITKFHVANKLVAALCHGSAALLKATLPDGTLFLKGHRVTGFSGQEEIDVDRQKDMPFHLENALNTASNGFYEKAPKAWESKVIITKGGKLVTGQNPGSAEGTGKAILKVLLEGSTQDE